MLVRAYRLPGAETHRYAKKIVEFAEDHSESSSLGNDQLDAIIPDVKKLKEELLRANLQGTGENSEGEPDHIILAQKALEYAKAEDRRGRISLDHFFIAKQHASQKRDALRLVEEHAVLPSAEECFSKLEKAMQDIHEKALHGVNKSDIDELLRAQIFKERTEQQVNEQERRKLGNIENDGEKERESLIEKYRDAWKQYNEIAERIESSNAHQLKLSEDLRLGFSLIQRIKEIRSDVLKHRALVHFLDQVFIMQFIENYEPFRERADRIRRQLKKEGYMSEYEIEQCISEWRQHDILAEKINSTYEHSIATMEKGAKQVVDIMGENTTHVTRVISHEINTSAREVVDTIGRAVSESTEINNLHMSKILNEAVEKMQISLSDFTSALAELQYDQSYSQVQAMHTMLQNTVRQIADNNGRAITADLLPSLESKLVENQNISQRLLEGATRETDQNKRIRKFNLFYQGLQVTNQVARIVSSIATPFIVGAAVNNNS